MNLSEERYHLDVLISKAAVITFNFVQCGKSSSSRLKITFVNMLPILPSLFISLIRKMIQFR